MAGHPDVVVDHLRVRFKESGRVSLEPAEVAEAAGVEEQTVASALDALVDLDVVIPRMSHVHVACGVGMQPEEAEADACPHCERRLDPDDVVVQVRYVRDAARRRDVSWVLTVHGMNTRAVWQEELSWRAATTYRRSVPVYAFRYGRVEVGVLLRWRQRQLADRLATTIRRLASEPQGSRLGPRPDIICHSFGNWLVGHALLRHPDLQVGRIVLVASILRPDFDWEALRERGQVEAVLNHRAGRDWAVPLATYFIPDAGPSGRRGFDPNVPVVDRVDASLGHSNFFDADELPRQFADAWQPFLRTPLAEHNTSDPERDPWRQPPWPVRATISRMVLLVALVALGLLILSVTGAAATAILRVIVPL